MRSRTQPIFRLVQPNEYCNTNYALLGMIAEKVDRKPLAQAMRHDRLFAPLHLQHTELPAPRRQYHPQAPSRTAICTAAPRSPWWENLPYTPGQKAAARAGTLRPKDYTDVNHSVAMAAGGAISTANDLATWIKALVTGRVLNAKYQSLWLIACGPLPRANPKARGMGMASAK